YSSITYLPLHQLTVLHLPCSRLRSEAALAVLRRCPALVKCTLGLSDSGDTAPLDTEATPTPCRLPALTQLTLRPGHHTFADFPRCLEALALPRLTCFSLKDFYPIPQWPAACTHTITRSAALQILRIDVPIAGPELDDLLQLTPHLNALF